MKKTLSTIHIPRRFVLDAWGGTETVVLETCRRLPTLGIKSKIFCPAALSKPGPDSIGDVPVERFPYFYPYLGLSSAAASALDLKGGNLFSFALYRKLMKEPELDLIHLHTAKRLGGIGRTAALKRGIPYVISIHGGMTDVPADEAATWTAPTAKTVEWGKLLGMMVGSRRVLDDAAAIICVDQSESERMKKLYPSKRVEFVPNGVDPEPYRNGEGSRFRKDHGIGDDRKIILNISRIDPQKNQLMAVDVLDRVRQVGEDAMLVLIGPVTNVEYHAKLEAEIQRKGLSDHVLLIPGLPPGAQELYDAYAAADLFLLSSNHEPFGIVILEAWAAGAPVVAASVGGVPDFTHHGEDVLRFERGNAEEAARHALSILRNPDEAQRLREAAARLVEVKYHWNTITKQLADLYRDVVKQHKQASA
jgi:glycosyltransferase involved in cell wall biosynthesis